MAGEKYNGSEVEKNEWDVKEAWFNGLLKGNAEFPQRRLGIFVYTADAVLADPPRQWAAFPVRTFTQDQLGRLSVATGHLHHKHGIQKPTEATRTAATPQEDVVGVNRFNQLWKDTARKVRKCIFEYCKARRGENIELDAYDTDEVQKLFDDKARSSEIDELKRIVTIMVEILNDGQMQTLAKQFRDTYGPVPAGAAKMNERQQIGRLISDLFAAQLKQKLIGVDEYVIETLIRSFDAS